MGLLLSALATQAIGIHALSGAFLWGALLPPKNKPLQTLTAQLQPITTTLLLPAFFVPLVIASHVLIFVRLAIRDSITPE